MGASLTDSGESKRSNLKTKIQQGEKERTFE